MIKIRTTAALLFSLVLVLFITHFTQAQSSTPQETLQQYIADLQNSPNDNALREKIITLVQTMKPAPAIPEEARKHFVMAQTLQGKAKNTEGFELAISEYKEVLLIAPWWPEAYNNMGILLEQVGQYDEAMRAFKLYVLTSPKDAREAQDKIYAIEAANKLAQAEERESSPEAIAAKKRKENEEWLKKLDGARFVSREAYTYKVTNDPRHGYKDTFYSALEIRGNEVRWGRIWTTTGEWEYDGEHESIEGRGFTLRGIRWRSGGIKVDEIAIISDDGNTVTYEADNGQHILYRQPKRR